MHQYFYYMLLTERIGAKAGKIAFDSRLHNGQGNSHFSTRKYEKFRSEAARRLSDNNRLSTYLIEFLKLQI